MSIRVMSAVWDSGKYDGGTLLVLLAMADYANDEDGTCHPSVGRLAEKARLGERQVARILNRLKDDGVIAQVGEKPSTQGRPIVVYRIDTNALKVSPMSPLEIDKGVTMSPLEVAKGDICDAKGDIGDMLKVTPMSDDPSLDPSLDPSEEGTAAPSPAAEEPPTTIRSLTQQPPVAIYRDTFLRYPPKAQMAMLMAHGIDDLRRWREVTQHWLGRGWNLTNISGMLDLYDHPERMEERSRPPAHRTPPAQPARQRTEGLREWFAELSQPDNGQMHGD